MHTIRLFMVTDPQGKHHVFAQASVEALKAQFTEEEYALFSESGEWKEIHLHEPLGRHEEEINRLCIVRDDNDVFRLDTTKLAAARAKVLIESWIGFPAPFSIEVYANQPLILTKIIDAHICEYMNPAPMGKESFFQMLKKPSSS